MRPLQGTCEIMGIFGHKSHDEYLFCFENLENNSQDIQVEYSSQECEYELCPFLPLKGDTLCTIHRKEMKNIEAGRNPDENN